MAGLFLSSAFQIVRQGLAEWRSEGAVVHADLHHHHSPVE
jgi:hypothetical protein